MSRMTGSYELGRISEVCAATGEALKPGTAIVAALVEVPEVDALSRVDVVVSAWEGGFRPGGLFAFWRTTVPESDRKPRVTFDEEGLVDLFHSMDPGEEASADDRRVVFRYILALLLIRRRRLVQVSAEGPSLRVRVRGAEEGSGEVSVAIPSLDASALADATEQLSGLIGTGA